jgi:hypothetical protein
MNSTAIQCTAESVSHLTLPEKRKEPINPSHPPTDNLDKSTHGVGTVSNCISGLCFVATPHSTPSQEHPRYSAPLTVHDMDPVSMSTTHRTVSPVFRGGFTVCRADPCRCTSPLPWYTHMESLRRKLGSRGLHNTSGNEREK